MRSLVVVLVLLSGLALAVEPAFVPATDAAPSDAPWMLGPWRKVSQPVMRPGTVRGAVDSRNVYNAAAIYKDGVVELIYRAESLREPAKTLTGRLCLATSRDGIHFHRFAKPLLVPSAPYERMGVEDPRVVKVKGVYYLTYTGWDGHKARLCLATSTDLKHWTRHGPLFPNFVPTHGWTKSGAILSTPVKAGPYRGKYVMYFGDTSIWMATSEDLLHWHPHPRPVFSPRKGFFDNVLVESGPPPILTRYGILLVYNGAGRFPSTGNRLNYATGQILLDPDQPDHVVERCRRPFLSVTLPWERNGYVDNVTFAEGLVRFRGQWHLYYGGADHVLGMAVAPVSRSR